jgi:ABC-type antimicrobial peptide transport system permease subunit
VGITCCLIILIFIQYETSFDESYSQADRTYRIVEESKFSESIERWNTTAYPLADALRRDINQIDRVTQASGPTTRLFRIEDGSGNVARYQENDVLFVDPFYPNVFDLTWLAGDPETALNEPGSIILTESIASKYFGQGAGHASRLGKIIELENKDALVVTGIIKDAPANTSLKYSLLIPYSFFKMNNEYFATNWSGNYQGTTFIQTKTGESIPALENQINKLKKKYMKPEDDKRITYFLQPLKGMHNDPTFGHSPQSYVMPTKMLYAAGGVAAFILIIACVNFINLSTAQAANRSKEVGIRKVLGSSGIGLVRQFLLENIILVALAILLALALTQVALSQINQRLSIIELNLQVGWSAVLFILMIGCSIILFACFYPSFVMASYRPIEALKNKFNNSNSSSLSLRRLLIIIQFSIVQIFIISTLVVSIQMEFFKNKDLGFFNDDPILLAPMPDIEHHEIFKQKLLSNPAITDVSFASSGPMSFYNTHYGTTFRQPHQPEEEGKVCEMKGIDRDYLDFYKLELIAGRNIESTKKEFTEFIVNEKLIEAVGWTPEEAVGKKLKINEGEATIVGVVKNFHNTSLQEELTPCVFVNWSYFLEVASIKIGRDQTLTEALTHVEKTWKEIFPEEIYAPQFLEDAIAKNYVLQQLVFDGFKTFAILTACTGCLGLYGLLSFLTLRKTKEVGIRKVLGATISSIVVLFSKEFIMLILLSFVLAAPVAYYVMDQWLQDFAYRIQLSWWIFLLGALLTIFFALVTITYQNIKAAIANPVNSLRME